MRIRSSLAAYLVVVLLVLFSRYGACQQGMIPYGLNYKIYESITAKSFPAMDTVLFARYAAGETASQAIAYNFKTNITPHTGGSWKTIVPGVDSWLLKLHSGSAYGLALVLSGVDMMPGETLYIYNQQGLRGPYTHRNVPRSGILPLDFLPGDEIMIEYDIPAAGNRQGTFVVETVSHAFQNIFTHDSHPSGEARTTRYDDGCYLCLVDDAIAKERRAVVKLIVQYENSAKFCTGTLVNNSAGDNKPYILTAEHCVSSQADADRTVFIFGFEDEKCIRQANQDLILNGAHLRASLFENDFSLLELYDKPPLEFHPYYAGWDISDQHLNGVTCIHHPQGGPRKVTVSNSVVRTGNLQDSALRTPDAFWQVIRWDAGATEIGSSGASLLNNYGHIIGTLSGGSSTCDAPYNDYFEKLSASWQASPHEYHQLKYWLDPAGRGLQRLDGSDPFEGIHVNCNTVSNIEPAEQQTLLPYTGGEGYFSGYNSGGIASYAEKFSVADSAMVTGVMLNVGNVNKDSPGGLLVSVHGNDNGTPGPPLSNYFIPYSRLRDDSLNHVGFYPYIKLAGDFFISYTLSYSPADSFALKQADWRSSANNTAFVKLASGWKPMSTISPGGAGSSLALQITLCEDNAAEPLLPETSISFYPNPATTVLIAKLPGHAREGLRLQVYDLQGRRQNIIYSVYETSVVIITADLAPGMYIVKLAALGGIYRHKFIKTP